jgi:hypothetical protein
MVRPIGARVLPEVGFQIRDATTDPGPATGEQAMSDSVVDNLVRANASLNALKHLIVQKMYMGAGLKITIEVGQGDENPIEITTGMTDQDEALLDFLQALKLIAMDSRDRWMQSARKESERLRSTISMVQIMETKE